MQLIAEIALQAKIHRRRGGNNGVEADLLFKNLSS
jgi:hypothetical protein